MQLYAACSGAELYSAVLQPMHPHLGEYVGVPFNVAAYDAMKFRICICGVMPACFCNPPQSWKHVCNEQDCILPANQVVLYPGIEYTLRAGDRFYYIGNEHKLSRCISCNNPSQQVCSPCSGNASFRLHV